MTPLEMAANAARAMVEPGTVGVVLTIPKGSLPRSFPRGELLNEMERDGQVERTYHFNPEKVLAWLIKNGLVEMGRTNDTELSFRVPNNQGGNEKCPLGVEHSGMTFEELAAVC